MIGIYKITNKMTGKSYIGQSIHCGKRLDEHCKGNSQFIDQMIEFDGIENYTFEILKTVKKEELNYWEDYYILQYNTMYPNGYNKRWNTSEEIRKMMKVETIEQTFPLIKSNQNIKTTQKIEQIEEDYSSLTEDEIEELKSWQLLRKKLNEGKVIFWDDQKYSWEEIEQFKRRNPNQVYIQNWYEQDIYDMPNSVEEFKTRKKELQDRENSLIRPTRYHYQKEDYCQFLNEMTASQKNKCKQLSSYLSKFNESFRIYYLNRYGAIQTHHSFLGDFVIDEYYHQFALNLDNMNANAKYSWLEMFEKELFPNNNIQMISKTGCFIDINDINKKKKVINRVLFY